MEMRDYYCGDTVRQTLAYNLGRGVRYVQTVTTQTVNPVKGALAVAATWGSIQGLVNYSKCRRAKISKREAIVETASESAGLGVAAGLGLFVSSAVRSSLLIASTWPVVPFVVGVAVTASAKAIWDAKIRPKGG